MLLVLNGFDCKYEFKRYNQVIEAYQCVSILSYAKFTPPSLCCPPFQFDCNKNIEKSISASSWLLIFARNSLRSAFITKAITLFWLKIIRNLFNCTHSSTSDSNQNVSKWSTNYFIWTFHQNQKRSHSSKYAQIGLRAFNNLFFA